MVTGGCSGIGAGMAAALARAGARVVLVARDAGRLGSAADGLRACGGEAAWVSADLAERAEVARAADEAAAAFGPPDILVNCAGINLRPPLGSLTVEDWDVTMAVNLTAPFLLGQRFGPAMADRGWGRIINVTSQQAARAFGNSGGYGASKGGLAALTRSQSEAWAPSGVCCNSVCPGFVPTRLNAAVAADPERLAAMAGADDDRAQRVAGGLRRGGRVPGLAGQRLRDRPDPVRGRRVLGDLKPGGAGRAGLFCRAGTAECSVWQDDEAVPPRHPRT